MSGGAPRVPRSLAPVMLARVATLSPAARQLAKAAAVLGQHCELAAAAVLADLTDSLSALGEAVAAGILMEEPGGAVAGIGFSHLLMQRAVYEDLSPARRRRLHQRAADLVDPHRALGHRVAAAAGPNDGLAAELEAAARESRCHGRTTQAAAWLAEAAALSGQPEVADRRLLDALEILLTYGEVAEAEALAARMAAAAPDARRSWLLGTLDFLAGRIAACEPRAAVARLRSARQRLVRLGARPYVEMCDRELAAADAAPGGETAPALVLTPAEQAVAGLVAAGDFQPANRSRAVRQRQDCRIPPRAHLQRARHPVPQRPHQPLHPARNLGL